MAETADSIERREDMAARGGTLSGVDLVRYWLKELTQADKAEEDWRKSSRRCIAIYQDQRDGSTARREPGTRFNVLWANTETLAPALYSQTPVPDVRRRLGSRDPVGRQASMVLEKALAYTVDAYDFDEQADLAVLDYLLTGRGVLRVRYTPTFAEREVGILALYVEGGETPQRFRADTRVPVGDEVPLDATSFTEEYLAYEEVTCERVAWDDFRVCPARSWDEARWVAFRSRMTREELVEAFGKTLGEAVPLDVQHEAGAGGRDKRESESTRSALSQAEVWQIWDKTKRRVVTLAPGYKDGVLSEEDDPLGLEQFFPVPRPIYSIRPVNRLVPKPEYEIYEALASEMNELTRRIQRITKSIKAAAIYDRALGDDLARLLEADDADFLPASQEGAVAAQGGIDKFIWDMPVERRAQVLQILLTAREQTKQALYEVTGLSDILRGQTRASETLGAQQLKSRYAGLRIQKRQQEIQRLFRDVFRLKAEIMSERFAPSTLAAMTDMALPPEVVELLRNDALRGFRIDVETDSTVAPDQERERQDMTEFVTAFTQFIQAAGSASVAAPEFVPVYGAMLQSTVRQWKLGRKVEDTIDEAVQMSLRRVSSAGQQPDPARQQAQMEAEAQQQEAQIKMQALQAKAQADLAKAQAEIEKIRMEMEQAAAEHAMKLRELSAEERNMAARQAVEREKVALQERKLEMQEEATTDG